MSLRWLWSSLAVGGREAISLPPDSMFHVKHAYRRRWLRRFVAGMAAEWLTSAGAASAGIERPLANGSNFFK